ncbi:MAG TPA: ABC transporter substrate-binding protein [Burkholderiales bacterium]|nr:ABC transporter substrate-binding protein [Burkholderiales bacterium]
MAGVVLAQQPGRVPVVGMLITHPPVDDPVVESVRIGLRQYGYEDGKNIKLEVRSALGRVDRVPALAGELVRLRVDVIVLVNEVALQAVRQATMTIPIVMVGYTDDPVAVGWIESYRHPGGNVTGIFNVNSALAGKRLEILKETLPNVSRVAVLWDNFGQRQLEELRHAAELLHVQLEPIQIQGPKDLAAAFKSARRKKAGAVYLTWSPVFYVHRVRLATLALESGLATVTDVDVEAEAGCLLSYGSGAYDSFVRAGYFVDRLLKGAKASDLPVEQISTLKLVVNLKTADALGTTIPQSILLRADEVIR